jgi:hypothetical protein
MNKKSNLSKSYLTATLLLTGLVVQAQDNGYTCISRQTTFGISFGGGGCGPSVVVGAYKGVDARVAPGHTATFTEDQDGGISFTIRGNTTLVAEGPGDLRPREERPPSIPIPVDRSLNASSEFTEVTPGSGIFMGARHSLQEIQFGGLSLALAKDPQGAGSRFKLFGFRHQTLNNNMEALDALILVQQKDRKWDDLPDDIIVNQLISEIRTLLGSDKFTTNIQPQDLFYSYQMSPDHTRGQRNLQDSLGPIYSLGESGNIAFLPLGGENYTAPGSSGSLIFVRPKESQDKGRSAWKIGGLVSCGVLAKNAKPSDMLFSKIEVITAKALYNSEIYEVFESDLKTERRSKNPNCLPLDGRHGGGF